MISPLRLAQLVMGMLLGAVVAHIVAPVWGVQVVAFSVELLS